jgi:alkylation response protein AidB-like acyl-CoA dehydrogenase
MSNDPKQGGGVNATKEEAMAVAEAARETEWKLPSFGAELFKGNFRPDLIAPFPAQSDEDRKVGDEYLTRLEKVLREKIDADEVDRTGDLPDDALQALIDLGCFGMKIPKEYGGLGFSQTNYNRAIQMVASHCGSTAVWISAHQSIGVPQPIRLFGTEEQKKKYLPRLAAGAISAFALTEVGVGSDPARMETVAEPTEDGKHFIINGTKLWCTNGVVADIIVVMARTPSIFVNGKERQQITAFIVEKDMPGFEVVHRCDFMGIRAIQNGVLSFENVKVPAENVIWGLGKGLKLALITLNTGRLTVPAATTGMARQCLRAVRRWSNERTQWGAPIGKHDAVANKIGYIASHTFAMDSVTWFTSGLADRGGADIRLEAAMAKLFCTEVAWTIADETVQIRGGRGYEKAQSLRARGEDATPVERMLRDCRINRIIEGTSEIMKLFIAREALDFHMQTLVSLQKGNKIKALLSAIGKYATWYPQQWLYWALPPKHNEFGEKLGAHLRFVDRTAHKLARSIFHVMGVYQLGLEKRQMLLGRFVDIGVDLFAMAATSSNAQRLLKDNPDNQSPVELADHFCRLARRRIKDLFRGVWKNDDMASYKLAQTVLKSEHVWLEDGVLVPDLDASVKDLTSVS